MAEVSHHKAGTPAIFGSPGDLVLFRGSGIFGALIGFGQRQRHLPGHAEYRHAGLVTGKDGQLDEAVNTGVQRNNLRDYEDRDYAIIHLTYSPTDLGKVLAYAEKIQLTHPRRYGFVSIISIGLDLLAERFVTRLAVGLAAFGGTFLGIPALTPILLVVWLAMMLDLRFKRAGTLFCSEFTHEARKAAGERFWGSGYVMPADYAKRYGLKVPGGR